MRKSLLFKALLKPHFLTAIFAIAFIVALSACGNSKEESTTTEDTHPLDTSMRHENVDSLQSPSLRADDEDTSRGVKTPTLDQ